MVDVSKFHPLFDRILAGHFHTQTPSEDVRLTARERYLEDHESREELREPYNDHARGMF